MYTKIYKQGHKTTFDEILMEHGYRATEMETITKFTGKWRMRAPNGGLVTFEMVPRGFIFWKWDLHFTIEQPSVETAR
jgi:hypothetical protein